MAPRRTRPEVERRAPFARESDRLCGTLIFREGSPEQLVTEISRSVQTSDELDFFRRSRLIFFSKSSTVRRARFATEEEGNTRELLGEKRVGRSPPSAHSRGALLRARHPRWRPCRIFSMRWCLARAARTDPCRRGTCARACSSRRTSASLLRCRRGTFFAPHTTFFGSARRTHHADAPLVRWTDPDPSVFLARVPNASPGPPRADAGGCAAWVKTTSVRLARAPRSAAAAAAHRASLGRDVPRADLRSRRVRSHTRLTFAPAFVFFPNRTRLSLNPVCDSRRARREERVGRLGPGQRIRAPPVLRRRASFSGRGVPRRDALRRGRAVRRGVRLGGLHGRAREDLERAPKP